MSFSPHDAAVHAIGRSRALLVASKEHDSSTLKADMRRLSVVMAVAALDTYMHRLVVDRCFTHGDALPGGLAGLTFSFAQLLEKADDVGAAARLDAHNSRPRVAVKRQLRDRLLRETFQRYDAVTTALGMAGRKGSMADVVAELVPTMTPKHVKTRLNAIVDRRNRIVHEGDYKRMERPQGADRNAISYRDASSDINFLAKLIDAIHDAV